MKQNNFFLNLLGDYYSVVGSNAIENAANNNYSKFLFQKFESIVHRYLESGKIGYIVSKTCFIDIEDYDYNNGFSIIDINGEKVRNIEYISLYSTIKFKKVKYNNGYYRIPSEIRDDILNKNNRYNLVYTIVKEDKNINNGGMYNNSNFPKNLNIQKDAIELLMFSIINGNISKKQIVNFISILLGSPFSINKEEIIEYIGNDLIKTNSHTYPVNGLMLECNYSVGDSIPSGESFFKLCKIINNYDCVQYLKHIESLVTSNGKSIDFLEKIYRNVLKSTIIIEINSEIFYSSSKESLKLIGILNEYIKSQRIVCTIEKTVEDPLVETYSSSKYIKNYDININCKNKTYSKVINSTYHDITLKEESLLLILSNNKINIIQEYKNIGGEKKEEVSIVVKDKDTVIRSSNSEIKTNFNGKIDAKLSTITIGNVTGKKFLVKKISDIVSFSKNFEKSKYLIDEVILARTKEKDEKLAKIISDSIADLKEIPVMAYSEAIITKQTLNKSYHSTKVEKVTVDTRNPENIMIKSISLTSVKEDNVRKILDFEKITIKEVFINAGLLEIREDAVTESNLSKPIISTVENIDIRDYVYVDAKGQIDF